MEDEPEDYGPPWRYGYMKGPCGTGWSQDGIPSWLAVGSDSTQTREARLPRILTKDKGSMEKCFSRHV